MLQSLANQQGEVSFRKKLTLQHKSQTTYFPNVPNHHEILDILTQRNTTTSFVISRLLKQHIAISPFLEIGAEKAARSALLVNRFKSQGFALDLSLESLLSAQHFANRLGLRKLPILICADAYQLPFANKSIPFVFCFETLHHFPDPTPIFKEVFRVTSSSFYFDEEPVSQLINIPLWRRDYKLTPLEKILKTMLILPFLSKIGKSETEHSILENSFWLNTWEKAISVFPKFTVNIKPVFFGPNSKNIHPNLFTLLLVALQGGGISGLCSKITSLTHAPNPTQRNILDLLACPTCHTHLNLNTLRCTKCRQRFVRRGNVYILLPEKKRQQLYGF
jgi:ubiquinone/menaquinone biosynthesis C-methylase UbiE/uncharacterized protein YbaR (Trm112 family)